MLRKLSMTIILSLVLSSWTKWRISQYSQYDLKLTMTNIQKSVTEQNEGSLNTRKMLRSSAWPIFKNPPSWTKWRISQYSQYDLQLSMTSIQKFVILNKVKDLAIKILILSMILFYSQICCLRIAAYNHHDTHISISWVPCSTIRPRSST